jgi:hypothetical protein
MRVPAYSSQPEVGALFTVFSRNASGEAHLKVLLYGHPIFVTVVLIWVGILGLSSWTIANRMQRRIKNDLGKTVGEGDLSSLETWIKVDEVEKKRHPSREWAPESSPSDSEDTERDL